MKVIPAIIFISIGIWLAYTYPEWSAQAFEHIDAVYNWLKLKLQQFMA
jgi:hypothetical protein